MKIIHGKDYYDTANYGIDPDIIFVRDGETPESIDVRDIPFPNTNYIDYSPYRDDGMGKAFRYNFQQGFIFFAGEVFPFIRMMYNKTRDPYTGYSSPANSRYDTRGWSPEAFDNYNIDYFYDNDSAIAAYKRAGYPDGSSYHDGRSNEQRIHDHFFQKNPTWSQWLISNNVVTGFYIPRRHGESRHDDVYAEFNSPCLTEFQFFKAKDAFTANQDIANYVGGVLPANANPMIELDNKHKIMKAGFDLTTSFRKGKTKHLKRKG